MVAEMALNPDPMSPLLKLSQNISSKPYIGVGEVLLGLDRELGPILLEDGCEPLKNLGPLQKQGLALIVVDPWAGELLDM